MSILACHSAIRLFPPDEFGRWRVENLITKNAYNCSQLVAMLLVAFMGGTEKQEVIALLQNKYSLDEIVAREAIDTITELGLLVGGGDESHELCAQLCRTWSSFGWVDTADYQLATLDYPFANYASDGREIDFQRMREYVADEPDTQRAKSYPAPRFSVAAPDTYSALASLDTSFLDVWNNEPSLQYLTKARCLTLLSAVFGVLLRRELSDSPDLIAAALNKTSPSGGARHPTEAYLFAYDVKDLSPGIYHFNMETSSLDAIGTLDATEPSPMSMFSGPMRASFQIDAFVVMTSVIDRSMWRYREPRSFRAIYMDVGHLCGTLDVVAKSLGVNCLVQHGLSERPISELLEIDTLTEGVIYGAALGGSHAG